MKFKWMKDQWKKITDRVLVGSCKAPVQEPAWYKGLNPIFSDTNANIEVATKASDIYTHICRIKGCGGAGCPPPPPIIFERLKLPQQIIYRWKENLSESPNHKKYWENILVSRFYEQFSRNRRNLGHFRKFEKISNS